MTSRALAVLALLASTPSAAQPGHTERVEHHDVASAPTRGPLSAPVTVEVFFVPGTANRQLAALARLQARHPSRVRLVYRVVASSGQVMVPSALLEAHAQGKFFPMLDAINARSGRLDRAQLIDMADRVGLDVRRVSAALSHGPDALEDNLARLKRVHRTAPDALFNGRPLDRNLSSANDDSLEATYDATYDHAMDLIDRGADPSTLADAFEQDALTKVETLVQPAGETDDEIDVEPVDPPLASPPLSLDGLPSFGKPDAAVPIVLLCSPSSTRCRASIEHAIDVARVYPEEVRVVWAPYYDVARPDAIELGLLGDAVLCAETVGTSATEDSELSSSGWRWMISMMEATLERHGRHIPAQDAIDTMATQLHVDPRAFAACRAANAGTAVEHVAAARHSGVRGAPTTVVGGRLYLRGLPDALSLQRLVEAELAPGVLGQLAPTWATR